MVFSTLTLILLLDGPEFFPVSIFKKWYNNNKKRVRCGGSRRKRSVIILLLIKGTSKNCRLLTYLECNYENLQDDSLVEVLVIIEMKL